MAEVILVAHVAVEHIGHRLEAAMRMRGEAGDVVVGIVGREVIEHQERVEPRALGLAEAAAQLHARSVRGGDGGDNALQGARGHGLLSGYRYNVWPPVGSVKSARNTGYRGLVCACSVTRRRSRRTEEHP